MIVHPETGSRRAGKRSSSSLQVLSFSVKSFHSMVVSSAVTGLKRLSWATGCALALSMPALAHGGAGGEALKPGEYKASPVITIEGHGGLENNLQGHPRHYAIDGPLGRSLSGGSATRAALRSRRPLGLRWSGVRPSTSTDRSMFMGLKRSMKKTSMTMRTMRKKAIQTRP